tara:strand:- start:162 stop:332 length:171 start_codon:yes stop_codon:yes gene_type:complete
MIGKFLPLQILGNTFSNKNVTFELTLINLIFQIDYFHLKIVLCKHTKDLRLLDRDV